MSKSYKSVERQGTVSDISDAFSEIDSLASEMRENADNMEGTNLEQTEKYQATSDAADTLESVQEPTLPDAVAGLPITYYENVNRRKGRGPSRSVRLSNAVAVISAARDAVDTWVNERTEELGDKVDENEEVQEAIEFVGELENVESEAEGVEFPGMYG